MASSPGEPPPPFFAPSVHGSAPAPSTSNRMRNARRVLLAILGILIVLLIWPDSQDGSGDDLPGIASTSSCAIEGAETTRPNALRAVAIERVDDVYIFTAEHTGQSEGSESFVAWGITLDGDAAGYTISGDWFSRDPAEAWISDHETFSKDSDEPMIEDLVDFDISANKVEIRVPEHLMSRANGEAFEWTAELEVGIVLADSCSSAFERVP